MNIKKLEDKIIHEVFEEVRDIPKGYDKDIKIRAKITERLLFDIKEKTVNKINKESN